MILHMTHEEHKMTYLLGLQVILNDKRFETMLLRTIKNTSLQKSFINK